jgi:hypothetical protein
LGSTPVGQILGGKATERSRIAAVAQPVAEILDAEPAIEAARRVPVKHLKIDPLRAALDSDDSKPDHQPPSDPLSARRLGDKKIFKIHPGSADGTDLAPSESFLFRWALAVVETTETEPRLRLLETTRAYALGRLAEGGDREAVARRHAEFYRDLFEKAETEAEARPAAEWLIDYAQEIDNLRPKCRIRRTFLAARRNAQGARCRSLPDAASTVNLHGRVMRSRRQS